MTDVLMEGLTFPEGPRWHDGRLWFSDMHDQTVWAVDEAGRRERIVRVPGDPSGLGWLPDGRLLVVSMRDRTLQRLDGDALTTVAELGDFASFHCNDMVVDAAGRAYVGNFGFDLHAGATPVPAALVLVTPDGAARVVADDLQFPNGTVIVPDGQTLIIAESVGGRLTAFDIAADGTLSNRRTWATLPGLIPDGICLDADGAIWVAAPMSGAVVRVAAGGQELERISVRTQAFACMLGGADGRTLFICTAEDSHPERAVAARSGRIETARVSAPRAGWP